MLEKLCVRNLGCLDETVSNTSFSKETVLIGPNNSGKSTFIAGLNLLKQVVLEGSPNFRTTLYNFYNWGEAIHKHDDGRAILITATINSVQYILEMYKGSIKRVSTSSFNWHSIESQSLMSNIWYLRPNRSLIPYSTGIGGGTDSLQPQLRPSGSDVIQFLLERYTERDSNWDVAEEWFTKIDPETSTIRTPIRQNLTFFELVSGELVVNASLQGSGFQSAASIISAVVFSPKGSIIIIEEPEICLHKKSQETIVDLFNDAVNNQDKQIIFSTHSWDMLLPFISDVGRGSRRGKQHVHTDPEKFTLLAFNKINDRVIIEPIDLSNMKVSDFKTYLKNLWG